MERVAPVMAAVKVDNARAIGAGVNKMWERNVQQKTTVKATGAMGLYWAALERELHLFCTLISEFGSRSFWVPTRSKKRMLELMMRPFYLP